MDSFHLASRLKAAGIHLGMSMLIATIAAALVFGLWYPWPYRLVSGGQSLFLLIMSVDLILGPALTFVVFNLSKSRSHLVRDLIVIVLLQLSGFAYGIYTVYLARPVAIVFEVDRFRVVADVDVLHEELVGALPELRNLSLTGPKIYGVRKVGVGDEQLKAFELSIKGFDIGTRPSYWELYEGEQRKNALKQARTLLVLYKHYPDQLKLIDSAVNKSGRVTDQLKFLPMVTRQSNWSVLLDDKTGDLVGFVPLDGFFE